MSLSADIGLRRRGRGRSRMADVARLAGVSTSTVSRALRQPDIVSAELRERIEEAIRRLAYRPNLMAGGLATARSRTVGVIVPSIINSFFAATVEEMTAPLAAQGYQVMLGNTGYSEETEEALVASFLSWSPAAIVLTGRHHSRQALRMLIEADLPIVEMWDLDERPIDCSVGFSNRAVGAAVARHFIAQGAASCAYIGAALDRDYRAAERGAGFLDAVTAAGLPDPIRVALPERANVTLGREGLGALLDRHPGTEAVFFSNDALALGGLFECRHRGIAVPDCLKLCGFGDLDYAAASIPALTTVRPPRGEIGRCVADLLIARFAGEGEKGATVDLGFRLIARDSG